MKRILYSVIAVLVLGAAGIIYLKKEHRFFYNSSISFIRFTYISRILNVCQDVVLEKRDLCRKTPEKLLEENEGKSSSLETLRILSSEISMTQPYIYNPRRDTKPWKTSLPINWNTDPFNDRNWQMSFESWRMLDGYFSEYERTKNVDVLKIIFQIMKDWYDFHITHVKYSKFAWNDMSTGYRADRLSKFLDLIGQTKFLTKKEYSLVLRLAYVHISYLTDPDNLSTDNHGVFEIAGLTRLCKVAPYFSKCVEMKNWVTKQTDLLTKNQFGPDGLQLEHSFGYHSLMISVYDSLLKENVYPLSEESRKLFEQTYDNEQWLKAPNGKIIPVGDTDESLKATSKQLFKDERGKVNGSGPWEDSKLFPHDGLAVVRTLTSGLWFYAFFHSTTHKHDDDLAFYLWDNDEPLLIDGGKYAYINDQKRNYVYSRYAHNTVIFQGLPKMTARTFYGSGIQSLDKVDHHYILKGKVNIGNIAHERELNFVPGSKLVVKDHITNLNEDYSHINFLFAPQMEKISQEEKIVTFALGKTKQTLQMLTFASSKTKLVLRALSPDCYFKTYKGVLEGEIVKGWYTPTYGELAPTWSATMACPKDEDAVTEIKYEKIKSPKLR